MTDSAPKWQPTYTAFGFSSVSDVPDERDATGKWLVPIPPGDPDDAWEKIVVAAANGLVPAAKRSAPRLDAILGHGLACVYSWRSREEDAAGVLATLRSIGIEGELGYKSCLATAQGRDDILFRSSSIEDATSRGPGTSLP